jgi:hypothetical protein
MICEHEVQEQERITNCPWETRRTHGPAVESVVEGQDGKVRAAWRLVLQARLQIQLGGRLVCTALLPLSSRITGSSVQHTAQYKSKGESESMYVLHR